MRSLSRDWREHTAWAAPPTRPIPSGQPGLAMQQCGHDVTQHSLDAGSRVVVGNLVVRPEYNGRGGRILSFSKTTAKYIVQLDDGKEYVQTCACAYPHTDMHDLFLIARLSLKPQCLRSAGGRNGSLSVAPKGRNTCVLDVQ